MLGIRPERESYTFSLARGQVPIWLSEHSSSVKGKPHSNRKSQLCPRTMLLQRSTCHSRLSFRDIVELTFETTSHNVSLGFLLTCNQEWLQSHTDRNKLGTRSGQKHPKGKQKQGNVCSKKMFLKCQKNTSFYSVLNIG